ncbi:hypothetical protein [Streptomyces sp. NPDC057460]|uniref:hypothetical protein n=1 Tax=Streptomyces sp. NPDC057460 TaxID=3346141 RepID=UPI00369A5B62
MNEIARLDASPILPMEELTDQVGESFAEDVGEERQQPVGGKVDGERSEPHLEVGGRRIAGGDAQPFRITAGDAYGIAVQLAGDNRDVMVDRLVGEGLAGEVPPREEPGVVVDAPCAYVTAPSGDGRRAPAERAGGRQHSHARTGYKLVQLPVTGYRLVIATRLKAFISVDSQATAEI